MVQSNPKSETSGKCPICGRPTVREHRPFCSRRCADIDLSRWLRGAYAIPGEENSKGQGGDTEDEEEGKAR